MWFPRYVSFNVSPRKLKLLTRSINISSILISGIKSSIFLFMAWKIIYSVFLVFKDNSFTASQSYTYPSCSLMFTGYWNIYCPEQTCVICIQYKFEIICCVRSYISEITVDLKLTLGPLLILRGNKHEEVLSTSIYCCCPVRWLVNWHNGLINSGVFHDLKCQTPCLDPWI